MTKKYKTNKYVALLTAIVLLFTCVSSLNVFASSDNANNPRPKEDAIKSKISEYFNARNAMLADLVFDSSIENYFTDSGNLEIISLETEIEHRKMQISDLKYVDYQCDLDYIEISTFRNTAKVSVIETNKINFNCSPDVDSEESYMHEISMKKTKGEWLIDSDENEKDFNHAFKNYKSEAKTRSAKTPQIIKSEILAQSKADSDLRKKNTPK